METWRANSNCRVPIKSLFVVWTLMACTLAFLAYLIEREHRGHRLELAIAQMPIGIITAALDLLLGDAPDRIERATGVIVNGVAFLSAENSKAKEHGEPEAYDLRIWKWGPVQATVRVAGRYTWR